MKDATKNHLLNHVKFTEVDCVIFCSMLYLVNECCHAQMGQLNSHVEFFDCAPGNFSETVGLIVIFTELP